MRNATLQLPQPCTQNWEAMTPASGGRHCAACAKTVVDFTQQTDAQILAYLRRVGAGQICGRLRAGQLSRPLQPAAPVSQWRTWLRALVAAGGLVSAATSRATAQVAIAQHPIAPGASDVAAHKATDLVADARQTQLADTLIELRGVVLDAERCEPLPGVAVVLKNSLFGTATDANGEFSLLLKPTGQPAQLVFSFVGFIKQEQAVALPSTPTRRLEIALDTEVMGGLLIAQSPPWPWHARAFYSWGKYWLTRPFRR